MGCLDGKAALITGETLAVDGCMQIRMPEKLYEAPIKLEQ